MDANKKTTEKTTEKSTKKPCEYCGAVTVFGSWTRDDGNGHDENCLRFLPMPE